MNTRQKIALDRWLGLPLVWVANGLARLAAPILRRDHRVAPETVRAVAVAKFFGMGSILQATPLLRALRSRFPDARLVFVTARANAPLMERLPCIDEVLYVDDAGGWALVSTTLRTLLALCRRRIDLYLDLEVYSAYASLISVLCLARNRFGFYRYSTAFKRGLCTHLIYFNARQPIRTIYLQLGLAAGALPVDPDALGPLEVRAADRASLARILDPASGAGAAPRYVVVNPNASDLLLERRWPAERFGAVIESLAADGERIVLTGASSEAPHVAGLVARLTPAARERVVDSAGKLALGELLALLEGAALVITNDTGPMHMAIALGRPTLCLFGPQSPDHYGIERPDVAILYRPVFCSPCVHEVDRPPCAGNNICMQGIEATEVVRAARRLLAGTAGPGAAPREVLRAAPDGAALGLVVRASVPTA
jgi:ADP-heptose:LPS heptosyltransferase